MRWWGSCYNEEGKPNRIWYQEQSRKSLGRVAFACVFSGTFQEGRVGVKRVALEDVSEREENALNSLMDHPNVIKLLHTEEDQYFKYKTPLYFFMDNYEESFLFGLGSTPWNFAQLQWTRSFQSNTQSTKGLCHQTWTFCSNCQKDCVTSTTTDLSIETSNRATFSSATLMMTEWRWWWNGPISAFASRSVVEEVSASVGWGVPSTG